MRLLLISVILLQIFSCSGNKSNENAVGYLKILNSKKDIGIVLKAKCKSTYRNFHDNLDSNYYFLVDLDLINNSDSICQFITMSCTSLINIVSSSDQIEFLGHLCASNYYTTINLAPKQEYYLPVIIILRNKYLQVLNNQVKFGFILVKPKRYDPDFNTSIVRESRKNLQNVIWSDPITLPHTSFQPYEIKQIISDSTYSILPQY